MKNLHTTVVIVAGGQGTRMNNNINKQFIKINNKEILAYTINAFHDLEEISDIIIVIEKNSYYLLNELRENNDWYKITKVVEGGENRQESVWNGLEKINDETEIVVIHDGARPFITADIIKKSIDTACDMGACGVGVPVKDTLKICDENNNIVSTPNRESFWQIQTPQTFRKDTIINAHRKAIENNYVATDDTALIEYIGGNVKIIMGDYNNIKITTSEDLFLCDTILQSQGKNDDNDTLEARNKIDINIEETQKIDNKETLINEQTNAENYEKKHIIIYTDGACSGNPGAGGYGVVMMHGDLRREISEGFEMTTNNRMEMLAVIKALEALKEPCTVDLYSDSKYIVDGITKKWVDKWQKSGWVKSDKKPVLNKDLWESMINLLKIHHTKFHWVKGHADNVENERCDELARQAISSGMLQIDENYNKNNQ